MTNKTRKHDGWSTSIRDQDLLDDDDDTGDDDLSPVRRTAASQRAHAQQGSDWDWDWSSELVDIGLVREPAALKFVETPFTLARRNAPPPPPPEAAVASLQAKLPTNKPSSKPALPVRPAGKQQQVSSSSPNPDSQPSGLARSPAQPQPQPQPQPDVVVVKKASLLASSGFRPATLAPMLPHTGTDKPALPVDEPSSAQPIAVRWPASPSVKSAASALLAPDTPTTADRCTLIASSPPNGTLANNLLTDALTSPTEMTLPSSEGDLCSFRIDSPAPFHPYDHPIRARPSYTSENHDSADHSASELPYWNRPAEPKKAAVRSGLRAPFVPPASTRPRQSPSAPGCHPPASGLEKLSPDLSQPQQQQSANAYRASGPSGMFHPRAQAQQLSAHLLAAPTPTPASTSATVARQTPAKPLRGHGGGGGGGGEGISPATRKRLDRFKRVGNFGTATTDSLIAVATKSSAAAASSPIPPKSTWVEEEEEESTCFSSTATTTNRTKVSATFSLPGLAAGGGTSSTAATKKADVIGRHGRSGRLGFTPAEPLSAFRARSSGLSVPASTAAYSSFSSFASSSPTAATSGGGARRAFGRARPGQPAEPVSPTPPPPPPPHSHSTGSQRKREQIVLGAAIRSVRPVSLTSTRPSGFHIGTTKTIGRPLAAPRKRVADRYEEDANAAGGHGHQEEEDGTEKDDEEARRRRRLYRSSLGL
ncbi:hypothetical protein JCM3774_000686 [Rhodotorula dairenensis]